MDYDVHFSPFQWHFFLLAIDSLPMAMISTLCCKFRAVFLVMFVLSWERGFISLVVLLFLLSSKFVQENSERYSEKDKKKADDKWLVW